MAAKASKQLYLPRAGDTFAVPLGTAGFGVVRVLRNVQERGRHSALVAVTPWLAPHVPELGEPILREILRKHFGRWGGQLALCWYEGAVPSDLQWIGTISPTDDELAIDPHGAFCGAWSRAVAHDVLRESGLTVEHVPAPVTSDNVDRVTGVMSDDEFWRAMDLLDWTREIEEEIVAPLLDHLVGLPAASIAGFHRRLCEKLFELDGERFAREIGEHSFGSSAHFSADHFLDIRCAAVARGQAYYDKLLSDPHAMVRDQSFESLVTVAQDAYERKTGRAVVFLGAKPQETFSNRAGWPETER